MSELLTGTHAHMAKLMHSRSSSNCPDHRSGDILMFMPQMSRLLCVALLVWLLIINILLHGD